MKRTCLLFNYSLIQLAYCVLDEFELELPGSNARINDPPPDCLGVYEEALKAGLRFPISSFILELLHFYRIPLCILIPNFVRHIIGF